MPCFPSHKNLVDYVKNMKRAALKMSDFAVLVCFSRRHYLLKTIKSQLSFSEIALSINMDSEILAWERESLERQGGNIQKGTGYDYYGMG